VVCYEPGFLFSIDFRKKEGFFLNRLMKYLSKINNLDNTVMKKAASRLDSLVKPPGSLGELETIAKRIAGIGGTMRCDTSKRGLYPAPAATIKTILPAAS
jgi:hypothetical protein